PQRARASQWTAIGSGIGMMGALLCALLIPASPRRIRTKSELIEATGMPLLGVLKDLRKMTLQEQERWAFQTFTTIRAKLADPRSDALVCGFTSCHHREGRSTWISLLERAAAEQGYRVITISADSPDPALQVTSSPMGNCALTESSPSDKTSLLPIRCYSSPISAGSTYSNWGVNGRVQWRQSLD